MEKVVPLGKVVWERTGVEVDAARILPVGSEGLASSRYDLNESEVAVEIADAGQFRALLKSPNLPEYCRVRASENELREYVAEMGTDIESLIARGESRITAQVLTQNGFSETDAEQSMGILARAMTYYNHLGEKQRQGTVRGHLNGGEGAQHFFNVAMGIGLDIVIESFMQQRENVDDGQLGFILSAAYYVSGDTESGLAFLELAARLEKRSSSSGERVCFRKCESALLARGMLNRMYQFYVEHEWYEKAAGIYFRGFLEQPQEFQFTPDHQIFSYLIPKLNRMIQDRSFSSQTRRAAAFQVIELVRGNSNANTLQLSALLDPSTLSSLINQSDYEDSKKLLLALQSLVQKIPNYLNRVTEVLVNLVMENGSEVTTLLPKIFHGLSLQAKRDLILKLKERSSEDPKLQLLLDRLAIGQAVAVIPHPQPELGVYAPRVLAYLRAVGANLYGRGIPPVLDPDSKESGLRMLLDCLDRVLKNMDPSGLEDPLGAIIEEIIVQAVAEGYEIKIPQETPLRFLWRKLFPGKSLLPTPPEEMAKAILERVLTDEPDEFPPSIQGLVIELQAWGTLFRKDENPDAVPQAMMAALITADFGSDGKIHWESLSLMPESGEREVSSELLSLRAAVTGALAEALSGGVDKHGRGLERQPLPLLGKGR